MISLAMVCYCCYSSIELTGALIDCQLESCPSRFPHVFQGYYVILNYIHFDGAERKICHDCVDKLRGRGKSETLSDVGYITVYGTDKSEKEK